MVTNNLGCGSVGFMIGCWGIYERLLVDAEKISHPDDIFKIRENLSHRLVYFVIGAENDFICLKYADNIYRVLPQGFQLVESPSCSFGDSIVLLRSNGDKNNVTIRYIIWHFERSTHYYRVEFKGKLLSRWVFEEDIIEKI